MGSIWFDVETNVHFQRCVAVGRFQTTGLVSLKKIYYILVVQEIPSRRNEYKRLGVGKIEARYVAGKIREAKLL